MILEGRFRFLVAAILAAACRSGGAPMPVPDATPGGGAALDGGDLSDATDGSRAPGETTGGGTTTTGRPAGTETECDGLDNDGDGYVDNVDIAGDGICDCLDIATVGSSVYEGRDAAFAAWLGERGGLVEQLGDDALSEGTLSPFDVVIVQDVKARAYEPSEIDALEAWVRQGGGLFTLTAYTDEGSVNVNALLAPFDLHYEDGLIAFTGPSLAVRVNPHPVTEMVSHVGVAGAYEVSGSGDVFAEAPQSVLDTVLGSTYLPVGRARTYQDGKVIAWGDEWITFNSDWVDRADFQVERLWQNALGWLGPEQSCRVEIPLI